MSRRSGKGRGGAVLVGVLTLALVGACDDEVPTTTGAAVSAASAPESRSASVVEVIDGDTFRLTDGEEVRVLGIDACEMSTDRGDDAKAAAQRSLEYASVVLTVEPGVDRDPSGRLLRYVSVGGSDFGTSMVSSIHTGVYEGRHDASPQRVEQLRVADVDGRDCDEPAPYVAPAEDTRTTEPRPDVDRRPYVAPRSDPDPDRDRGGASVAPPREDRSSGGGSSGSSLGPNTGDSGHPCLPGERDGDGDGWCGES